MMYSHIESQQKLKILILSNYENKEKYADALESNLTSWAIPRNWPTIFDAGSVYIEALERQIPEFD